MEDDLNTDNKDLVWDLESFQQRQRAIDYVMVFENKLCVYSDSVEQLYTNYNIFFPKEEDRRLVILPNPYAHHDVFQGLPEDSVYATGLNIIPGETLGKDGLYLTIPFRKGASRYRAVPLQMGLDIINKNRPGDRPLLPILKKGDLRELDSKTPCLHLHSLNLDKMGDLSQMERKGIQDVIIDRLNSIS